MKRHLLASLALLCGLTNLALATTYTVNTSTDPAFTSVTAASGVINDGAGAGSVSLRSAVIAANSSGAGPHVINVPAGTYNLSSSNPNTPGTTATTGNPDLQVGSHLSAITIQGTGGTPKIVQTIPGNDVITTGFQADGFTPAVVALTLDNLEITGGSFTGIFVGADDGAGHVSSTTITNCNIHGNSNGHAIYGQGGAIQAITGHLSISNTTFANNSATHATTGQGGAIYFSLPNPSGLGSTGSLSITGCTFTSNSSALGSGVGGGAIYTNVVSAGTTVSITGNTFTSNICSAGADGGAIAIDGNRTTDILRNTFISNSASGSGHGGAIVVNNGPTNINYNRFSGNTAALAANGLALHHSVGNASVVNANDNWWQSNTGPVASTITGAAVTATTWLRFTHTASPTTVSILSPDNTSTLTASFLTNSAGNPVSLANLATVIGQPISFGSAVLGSLSGAQAVIQSNGTATATFTAGSVPGAGGATATVHTAPAVASITVTAPDMTVAMSHSGNFIQGQTGKTYTITASNAGNAASGGLVTATISLPSGLTATGLSGTGWTINPGFLSATRSDALAASVGYPSLTLTVDVAADAGSPLAPSTTISGGGQVNLANDTSVDSTIVLSTDARLSNLTASLGSMSPAFASATTDYVLLVPAGTSSITLTPTVFQADATVTVNGTPVTSGNASGSISIGVGDTVITTVVTAQDGVTQKTYTVTAKTPPAIDSFTYDSGSGTLAATGSGMTPGDTIAVSKLTLSGEGGGTYALTSPDVTASSGTSFTVNLNSTDQAALHLILNKNGTSSTGGATYNVAAADDWNASFTSGDTSDLTNALAVTSVPVPAITSAAYDALAGSLNVTGTGFSGFSGTNNDIIASKFTLTGEGATTYTLTDTANVEVSSPTSFTFTLSATDKAAVNTILNREGSSSTSGTTYNLAAADNWAAGADPALTITDSVNGVTVSNVPVPTITSATYNVGTGALSVTGTGFVSLAGAGNDIDLTKLTLTGDSTPYALTSPSVEITSGTSFSATLNATDIAALGTRLNKNGTSSLASVTYNLAAAEDWAVGADSGVDVADLTGNGITVSNALNLAPVVTVPVNIAVTEDTPTALTGVGFSDPDAGSSSVTTTFAAGSGTLTATSGGGVTVAGSGTTSVTLTGSIANINSYIAGSNLSFLTAGNATADVTLGVSIDDGGNTGSGGAKTDSDNITLVVTAVNDAPAITAPGSIAVTEDVASALAGISFADVDSAASSVSVILSVGSGTLTASSGGGVTVAGGGTGSLLLNGSISNLNTFVAGGNITFLTALNATSNVTLSVGINDNGNIGSGGAQSSVTTVTLAITAVNDAPSITAPASQSVNQGSNLVFSAGTIVSLADVDAAAGSLQTTLSATHGTLSLSGTSGLSFTVGSGTGDATMTFTGTLTNLNNALNGLQFTPTSGYDGSAALQIDVNDQGNTGTGGAKTAGHTVNLTIVPQADLAITKTDGTSTATPGGSVTYTITASNAGPSSVTGATVADSLPATLTGVTWTAVGAGGGTATASGTGNINDTVNLPAGGSVTYTVTATISPSATGTLSNTATVGSAISDPTPGNNSATDSDTLVPQADLAITKTDGATTEIPGTSVTYTITASNAGPSNVSGATVADTLPANLTGATWTAVGAGGGTATASGSGNINDTVNLPAGGSVTYTVTATISPSATGTLSNTATVSSAITDPNPANNSATDTDTLVPQADLAITKTDGVTNATPGGSVTYTITASNAGPSNVTGATVADTLPASLSGTWTAVGAGGGTATASGSGNISDTVNLPVGASVTYTVTASISPSATGTLSNTATVSAPGGVTDPTPGNNSATDSDTLVPQADLAITKTDGATTEIPGTSVTYTITASNAGPSNVSGATVADTLPANLTGATWTAVGAGGGTASASGSGNINDTVNLPAGGSVTYTVTATISPSATGTLSNTATVSSAISDPNPANNSATDSDTLVPQADLAITKTDGTTTEIPGTSVTYTITASNAGPSNVSGATVADTLPANLTGAIWTAVGAGGGTASASGTGNINDTVNLPAGASVTYTVTATISASATGTLTNTATVSSSVSDPTPANNSATDTDTLVPQADLAVTISDSPDPANAGENLTYTIDLTNHGPSDAASAAVSLPLPASTTFVSASAPSGWTTSTPAVGANGSVTFDLALLPSGGSASFTVVAKLDLTVVNDSILTGTATTTTSATDPVPGNNSASTTTLAKSGADLQIALSDSPDPVISGTELTYTIDIANNGPLDADNVSVTDTLPAGTTFVSLSLPSGWTATTPAVGGTGAITLSRTLLAPSGTASFVLVVKVGADVADGTSISNTASVSSATLDHVPGNNSATATSTANTRCDLAVSITATPSTAPKGTNVSFAITLTNQGPSKSSDPALSLPIPSQMTFVSATTPAGWSAKTPAVGANGTVNFSSSSLDVGASATFTVVAKVNSGAANGTVLTATATGSASDVDSDPSNNSATASSSVGTIHPGAVQIGTSGTLNSQSGLFELTVNVTNTTPLPINGFRLHVDYSAYNAAYPSLRLYNASSAPGASDVYVDYPFPVAVDATIAMKLSFYTSTRTFPSPFKPKLTVEKLATSQVPSSKGEGVQPRLVRKKNGTILLEFDSVIGRWYRISFTNDLVNWYESPVPIQASTTRMQWIDSGPPFTDVPPAQSKMRFYRVNKIKAP